MPAFLTLSQQRGFAAQRTHHWMIDWGIAITATLAVAALLSTHWISPALAWPPEKELMAVKGYSPLTTEITQRERYHQEWKPNPEPLPTKWQMFAHNFYYNNWTGSVYPFGETRLEDKF